AVAAGAGEGIASRKRRGGERGAAARRIARGGIAVVGVAGAHVAGREADRDAARPGCAADVAAVGVADRAAAARVAGVGTAAVGAARIRSRAGAAGLGLTRARALRAPSAAVAAVATRCRRVARQLGRYVEFELGLGDVLVGLIDLVLVVVAERDLAED